MEYHELGSYLAELRIRAGSYDPHRLYPHLKLRQAHAYEGRGIPRRGGSCTQPSL